MDETTTNIVTSTNKKIWKTWTYDLRESRFKKVKKMIMQEKVGRMLDVGCSSGDFSQQFIDKGWSVYGIDIVDHKVEEAVSKGVKAVVGDMAANLPYSDGFFDVVLAGEVIEHLIDTTAFIKEINRVLKVGGKLILTTPNLISLENRIRIMFGVYPIWVDYCLGKAGHIRAYIPSTIKKHLLQNGFEVQKHVGNFVPPITQALFDDIKIPIWNITGDLCPSLSQCIIIKAQKV